MGTIVQFVIRRPNDPHVHFRMGKLCQFVVQFTARVFAWTLWMPNTEKAIKNAAQALVYQKYVRSCMNQSWRSNSLMSMKITDSTTPEMVRKAWNRGVRVGKGYFIGTTTNSSDGITITKLYRLYPVFAEMARLGMILSLHGEMPGAALLNAERAFLPILRRISKKFEDLKIVLEHVSTREGIETVLKLKNVWATLTVHHAVLTTSDVLGRPHNLCRPVAQSEDDRRAVVEAMVSGNPKFFFGSDSAPHPRRAKECDGSAFGIFVPGEVAMAILAEIFEREGKLDRLQDFTSTFSAMFYGLPENEETMTMIKKSWVVPMFYPFGKSPDDDLVPFMAGKTLSWQISALYPN